METPIKTPLGRLFGYSYTDPAKLGPRKRRGKPFSDPPIIEPSQYRTESNVTSIILQDPLQKGNENCFHLPMYIGKDSVSAVKKRKL